MTCVETPPSPPPHPHPLLSLAIFSESSLFFPADTKKKALFAAGHVTPQTFKWQVINSG